MTSTSTMGNVRLRRVPAAPYDIAPRLSVRYLSDTEGNGNWCWTCPVCRASGNITARMLKLSRWHICYPTLVPIDPEQYPDGL